MLFEQATLAGSHAGNLETEKHLSSMPTYFEKKYPTTAWHFFHLLFVPRLWHNCTRINYLVILLDLFGMIQ